MGIPHLYQAKDDRATKTVYRDLSTIEDSKIKKINFFDSDKRDYRRVIKKLYKACNHKNAPANSDYILFYAVYIERLFKHLKKKGVKDILFLAREGLFLKRIFDHYQTHVSLLATDTINTHYFKTSRQASMLVALKDLDNESFIFLRRKYPDLSIDSFLRNFTFSDETIASIVNALNLQKSAKVVVPDFLDSGVYRELKTNKVFRAAYEAIRIDQRKAFETYLDSFGIDFQADGMHLADIGWGGSMQESLYDYFEGKVTVQGHYLGLNEIYSIKKETPRWGLNFSLLPYATFSDNILRGNTELNEQLLSAGHGSTVSYNHTKTFTNEFHHEAEKKVFEEHILEIQEFMFDRYAEFLNDLDSVCYDDSLVQEVMTDYALRAGLLASKRKIAGAMKLSEGFYTNVGDFSNGLKISPDKYTKEKFKLLKTFFMSPDTLFPLLLRVKPFLYSKRKYYLAHLFPGWLIYWHIKINQKMKNRFFKR